MKKSTKIFTLVLSLVMLVGMAIGTSIVASASTEETTPPTSYFNVDPTLTTTKITVKNVEYAEYMHLAMAVDIIEVEGRTVDFGIAVFPLGTKDFEHTEPLHVTYKQKQSPQRDGSVIRYYATQGISAKDITTEYTFVVLTRDTATGAVNFGDSIEYSVSRYCAERKSGSNVSEAQLNLYNAIIEYGKAAVEIFKKN